jgi:diguanylate cyclase (GGDEF)-like protein
MAHNDRLTGLYNRHYMLECLENETSGDAVCFLALADIDDFKKINDHYGHNAGDAVLKAVSERMKKSCPDCLISRWGGEEFLFFAKKGTDDGRGMMEKMRQEIIAEPVMFEQQSIPVTITVGIADRQADSSIDSWIQDADNRLYTGKSNGKNQIVG